MLAKKERRERGGGLRFDMAVSVILHKGLYFNGRGGGPPALASQAIWDKMVNYGGEKREKVCEQGGKSDLPERRLGDIVALRRARGGKEKGSKISSSQSRWEENEHRKGGRGSGTH